MSAEKYSVIVRFITGSEGCTLLRGEMDFYPLSPPFLAIWEKFGVREPDIMILSFCEFHENRRRQGCT
jgi:hypothetical protein